MSEAPNNPYVALKADDRQELRLPALLKAHVQRVAERHGQSATEYMLEAIAQRVTAELEQALTWELSAAEVGTVLQTLATPAAPTPAMIRARQQADALFGPAPTQAP